METLLVAGFMSFPNAPANPTQALVEALTPADAPPGMVLERLVLPVAWERSAALLEAAVRRHRPASVLLFGLHARAERLRLELVAHNGRDAGRPDGEGRPGPAGPIEPDGPAVRAARLPVAAIEAALAEAGISCERSEDAGRYLCNETLYRLCGLNADLRHCGFVHVPVTDELADRFPPGLATLPAARLHEAARRIFACLAAGAGA